MSTISKLTATLMLILAVLHFSTELTGQSKKQRKNEYERLKAEVALIEHDYDKAIRLYTGLNKKWGGTSYLMSRGDAYFGKKDYESALYDWIRSSESLTAQFEVYERMVKAYQATGNNVAELETIKNAIERYNNSESRQMLTDYYKRLPEAGDQGESIRSSFRSLQIENLETVAKISALNQLMEDAEKAGDYDLFVEIVEWGIDEVEFDRDIKKEPIPNWWEQVHDGYRLRKAMVLVHQGQRNEAFLIAEDIYKNSSLPDFKGPSAAMMAEMHLLDGNYEAAISLFKKANALSDTRYYNFYQLTGECYYKLKDYSAARRVFLRMSEITGSQAMGKAYLSFSNIIEHGDPTDLEAIRKLVSENPDDGIFSLIVSRSLAILDKQANAKQHQDEVLVYFARALEKGNVVPGVLELSMMELNQELNTERGLEILAQNDLEPVMSISPVKEPGSLNGTPLYKGNEKRLALILGNGAYEHGGELANPVNDATDMSTLLGRLGFTVMHYTDLDQTGMKKAIDLFGNSLRDFDVGLFFYAGHGLQAKGTNYLVPVDAIIENESDVEFTCVDAGRILTRMEDADNRVNIIVLDACRNNPFERSWTRSSAGKGLAKMDAPTGSIIAYATQPGNTASDGTGENGLYTEALLEEIQNPGLIIERVFRQVRTKVIERSGESQIPWESTSLTGDFFFLEE